MKPNQYLHKISVQQASLNLRSSKKNKFDNKEEKLLNLH